MLRCGLLGGRLGHSYSPAIHHELGDYEYRLYEKAPEELPAFLTGDSFDGLNVTIPYKKTVMPYCTELSETARRVGCVNTIVRRADGTLYGDNTDVFGFARMLASTGVSTEGKKALVFGSGGASGTACDVLRRAGAQVVRISRSGEDNYENISRHYDAEFIINTTPVGMYPDNDRAVIDVTEFKNCKGLVDLIYNPVKTKLVMDAENAGIPAEGGLKMLVAQAAGACELFLGSKISDELIEAEYMRVLRKVENIILIGMPGCGKSSIGERLAEITGKSFADSDIRIIEQTGRSAEDIICSEGEEYFRKVETGIAKAEGAHTGRVIATGGGVVTRNENLDLLRQNGRIVYIKRSLEKLSSDGRPISAANKIEDLFSKRKAAYESWSDFEVDNTGIEETADKIAQLLGYGR